MEATKLHKIVAEKNERLERDALHTAERIIDQIAEQQRVIAEANDKIVELRKELGDLTVQQLDTKAILGA